MDPAGSLEPTENGIARSTRVASSTVTRAAATDRRIPIDVTDVSANGGEEASGVDWLAMLWRRRWWVIIGTALGAIGAFVALQNSTPLYSSGSQLYIQQQGLRANDSASLVTPTENLLTQAEVIHSTEVLKAASLLPAMQQASAVAASENPVGLLKQMVGVAVDDKTDIITVSAKSKSPDEAAIVVNSVVESYINFQARSKKNTAADVLNALQKEKTTREAEVDSLYNKMIAFKREKGAALNVVVSSSDSASIAGRVGTTPVTEVAGALTQVQLEKLDVDVLAKEVQDAGDDESKLREVMQSQPALAQSVAGSQSNADLWSAVKAAEIDLIRLRAQYGPANDRVLTLQKSIEMMQSEVASTDRHELQLFKIGVLLRQQWLSRKVDELQSRYDEQSKTVLAQSGDAMEFVKMQSELRRAEQMCDILDSRIKELNVNEETGGLTTNILEVAKPSGLPVSPVPAKYLAMGVMLGLMSGAGLGFVRDWADPRLRSVEDIRAAIEAPILGVVPRIKGHVRNQRHGMEVFRSPRSKIAEAYKTIRTAVYFESPNANAKTLLVTSPAPGDGKTTLASNLAIAMAQAGRRVLLIDADCRRPMQHRVFGLPACDGLSKLLRDEDVDPASVVVATEVPRLALMQCGSIPDNPSELLGSERFAQIRGWAASAYDMVVIDSPPVVPVTDARILAASCDLTILVLRANKTSRQMAAHAHDLLVRVGGNLLGVVVNDVHAQRHGYRYGYYYDYNYESHRDQPARNGTNGKVAHNAKPPAALT